MFGADMVIEPHKDDAYILNTARSYMQFLENERWRYFLVPSRPMYGLAFPAKTLGQIYEQAPRAFLMLDAKGRLPNRTRGWPIAGVPIPPRPPLPPLAAAPLAP
jgi:hypothetical protein